MQDSKLVKQLKLLDKEEFKGFYLFIRSPFFNQSKDVIRLFEYLRKYYPAFESPKLEKASLFKKLFPKQAYSDVKLRNLRSKLSKLFENYLLQLDLEQDDFKWKKTLTQIYGKRNFYVEFERGTQQLLDALEAQPYRDASFFYEKYNLEKNYFLYRNNSNKKEGLSHLENTIDGLHSFYTIENLRLLLFRTNRTHIYANEAKASNKNPDLLAILYKQVLQLFENHSDDFFSQTVKLLLDKKAKLTKEDQQNLLVVLINLALKRVRYKEEIYIHETFNLYKFGIENDILIENGKIHELIFLNAVIYASAQNNFKWVENFMAKYAQRIDGQDESSVLLLSKAFLHFNKRNFNQAIELLLSIKAKNKLLEISARTLSIRAYYELLDQDLSYYNYVESSLDSFYKFLKRDILLDENRLIAYFNFIKILKRILKTKTSNSPNNLHVVLNIMLKENRPVIAPTWLQKKIEAI